MSKLYFVINLNSAKEGFEFDHHSAGVSAAMLVVVLVCCWHCLSSRGGSEVTEILMVHWADLARGWDMDMVLVRVSPDCFHLPGSQLYKAVWSIKKCLDGRRCCIVRYIMNSGLLHSSSTRCSKELPLAHDTVQRLQRAWAGSIRTAREPQGQAEYLAVWFYSVYQNVCFLPLF